MFRSGGPVAAVVLIALSLSGSASGSPPSGPAIVFVRANDLFAVSLNGRVVRLTRTRTREVTPAVSFDGTRIAFFPVLRRNLGAACPRPASGDMDASRFDAGVGAGRAHDLFCP